MCPYGSECTEVVAPSLVPPSGFEPERPAGQGFTGPFALPCASACKILFVRSGGPIKNRSVLVPGLEPGASTLRGWRSNQLIYTSLEEGRGIEPLGRTAYPGIRRRLPTIQRYLP